MPAHRTRARRAASLSALPLLSALTLTFTLAAPSAQAAVRLPAVLSDHMVLQRSEHVPVWGWAAPAEPVSVQIGAHSRRVQAGADGRWRVEFDLRQAASALPSAATSMTVKGADNTIVVSDVLLGEVWLASGQSNMEKPIGDKSGQKPTFNAEAEIAAANYPQIRLFKTARKKSSQPEDDVKGEWVVCSPQTVDQIKFSAAAYFFGQRLHRELGTPVGLIDSTWGGTRIEPWTPAAAASASAGPPPNTVTDAAQLYNGMIAPLAPFAIQGAIWYQGESNIVEHEDLSLYAGKMAALVSGWRRAWQRDFAFYYVQVAPHLYHVVRHAVVSDPQAAPRLWEAQADALRIPGTGMIATSDLVDDLEDIHPRDKKSVGLRLAALALHKTYGRSALAAEAPSFRALAIDGVRAVLRFDHAQGLAARDNKPLRWFDIAGADGVYHPALASIEGETVVVTSAAVSAPVAVRFAWDEAARPNLVNGAGLPALPFRSLRPFDIAITVDDLPVHGTLPAGMTRAGIAQSYLATLRMHGVPEAFGFVNAAKIETEPDSAAALDLWRQAGYPLGNHTYTHMSLERAATLAAWQDDVVAGEAAVAARMAGANWHYLRFPYLAVGQRREAALAWLDQRGYRVADVSLSFADWDYTEPYARCVAKGDTAAIARMKAYYLQQVDAGIARMKEDALRVCGRIIPQVLLTHIGGWSAVTLPDVMARLDAAGAHYVSLAQAQSDPAYAQPDGGSVVERTASRNGIKLSQPASEQPRLDLKSLCL